MLSKLLKYEFKAMSKTTSTVFGLVLLSSLAAALISRLTSSLAHGGGSGIGFVSDQFNTITWLSILALAALPFIAFIFVINRFYTNFFKDEGYLTFTLPVKVSSLYNAKLITGAVIIFATGIFSIVGIGLVIMILTGDSTNFLNTSIITNVTEVIKAFFGYEINATARIIITEIIIYFILETVGFLVLVMLAVSISSTKLRKYKIAGGIGIYFALKAVKDIVNSIVILGYAGTLAVAKDTNELELVFENIQIIPIFLLITIVVSFSISVLAYILNNRVLTKSLNLE